jgi:16S rRNA (cytosine967-C5)-methyltransferase
MRQTPFVDQDLRWLRTHVYGACRTWHACAWLLAQASKTPLPKLDARVRVLLQLGSYWLRFVDTMPAYAAVQQTGELARQAGLPKHLIGFINGVLRHLPSADIPAQAWLPDWLPAKAEQLPGIVQALQQAPALGLRIRPGFDLPRNAMQQAGWQLTPTSHDPACWLAHRSKTDGQKSPVLTALTDLPGFDQGHWLIQDASSAQVATTMAQNLNAQTIVDACAGLGMKTMALADAYPDAHIIALEPDETRFALLQQNLQRCQLQHRVTCVQATAQQWQPDQPVDVLLTDVPCSATGTVRRHPEILLRSDPLQPELIEQQRDILLAALTWQPKHLVYSTCSVLPPENDHQVDWLVVQGLTRVFVNSISLDIKHDGFYIAILSF